jgi:hypothetical protein
MSDESDPIDPAAAPASDPATSVRLLSPPPDARHDGWTPARQAAFLRELAATHCVSAAARAVGMSRQSAYKLRNRLKDEPFDIAWQAAFRRQYDALAEALVERAVNGVEVPHFYKGELIDTSRRYDERAAVALLAMRERLTLAAPCFAAEAEGLEPDDFDTLVARVEYGGEWWDSPCGREEADEEDAAEWRDLDGPDPDEREAAE